MKRILELMAQIESHCPCGARLESITTHPHVGSCSVAELSEILNKRLTYKDLIAEVSA